MEAKNEMFKNCQPSLPDVLPNIILPFALPSRTHLILNFYPYNNFSFEDQP